MLVKYLTALWRHWVLLVTGGSLIAIVAIYAFVTSKGVVEPWGWLIAGATFVSASYFTWRDERLKVERIEADVAERQRRTATILHASLGSPLESQFALYVRLANPGSHPAAFLPEWKLDVIKHDGTAASSRSGFLRGAIRPLQQGDQFEVQIIFSYSDGFSFEDAQLGATYVLTGMDLERRPIRAEYTGV